MIGNRIRKAAVEIVPPAGDLFAGTFRVAGPQPHYAPPDANNDAYVTTDTTVLNGNVLDNDTPGDVPLQVTHVNGSSFAVGLEIILASGARLRVNADGSFTYNPNGAFNSLPPTNDSFTYTVAGGDSATVTVTVNDPPPGGINGTEGPDTLVGTPGDDVINGLGGDDTIDALGGNDVIDGGTGADAMTGGTGNDTFKVDDALDTIVELSGEGYDIVIATVNYTLNAGAHVEELVTTPGRNTTITLTGNDLDNIVRGGNAGDTLFGGGGNDMLDGGLGSDSLRGGTGDDIYTVNIADSIVELAGEGYDIAYVTQHSLNDFRFTLTAGAHVELIAPLPIHASQTLAGFEISGNELGNTIHGGAANDLLRGFGGNDTLVGFAGNDRYQIDDAGDVVVEAENGGIDTINTTISYQLVEGGNVENLDGLGSTGLTLVGNSMDNLIDGTSGGDLMLGGGGNDLLRGGIGNDSLYGGDGNDTLSGDDNPLGNDYPDLLVGGLGNDVYNVGGGDTVVEDINEAGQVAGSGDRINVSGSYTLAADQYIEILDAQGNVQATLTGNDIGQLIDGGGSSDTLFGLGGDDILYGGVSFPGAVATIDSTDGGFGNDAHYVDHASDVVVERAGEGSRDVVYASASYALAAGVYVEVLSTDQLNATAAINLSGNSFVQEIYGNAGANFITGGGGADVLVGLQGDDQYLLVDGDETIVEAVGEGRDVIYTNSSYVLGSGISIEVLSSASLASTAAIDLTGNELAQEIDGNAGNNFLNGGGGADVLVGFGGDDQYFITSGTETIVEHAGGGRDVAYTIASHVLDANIHLEVLSTTSIAGTAAINLTGNALVQELDGNNGANILNGGGGADTLVGFGGDDTYYVTDGGEFVVEAAGGGRDVVYATVSYALGAGTAVEILSTSSFGGTNAINLSGNELAQELYGNAGGNILNGGGGADYLVGFGGADFFDFTTALGGGNVDTIADMTAGSDKIRLDDAIFAALSPGGLPASAFVIGSQAADADDRIVYNSATGQLFYDADGSAAGAAVQFATLQAGLALTASDFVVI